MSKKMTLREALTRIMRETLKQPQEGWGWWANRMSIDLGIHHEILVPALRLGVEQQLITLDPPNYAGSGEFNVFLTVSGRDLIENLDDEPNESQRGQLGFHPPQ